MEDMSQVLRQLDDWRHLPAYQLERRVDVLFGMLLPTVIGEKYPVSPGDCRVIPEFPLHKGKLGEHAGNQSMNVDFAVFFEQRAEKRLSLVELKTDQQSISVPQIGTMGRAAAAGASELLVGVLEAAQASRQPRKYAHLIWTLHEIGCIGLPDADGFRKMPLESERPGLMGKKGRLSRLGAANVTETWRDARIDLIEIVPFTPIKEKRTEAFKRHGFCTTTFKDLANIIRRARTQPFGKECAALFACYLDRWAEVPAGKKPLGE